MGEFIPCFAEVPDPRASNARHAFLEVIFIALAAVLCGAEDCTDMALFARSKLGVLREVLTLAHGPPSHDTFSRVFRRLDPEPFEAAFAKFSATFARQLKGVVAIDGKALRGAYERGCKTTPLHLVNVWAVEARLAIGQRLAPGRNEALGARQALALLDLTGCIVTADALHCRADTAQIILGRGADYALAVKANQPTLFAKAQALTEGVDPGVQVIDERKRAHDRNDGRTAIVVPAQGIDFPGIAAVARVETYRSPVDKKQTAIVRYFLLSARLTPHRMLEVARAHWTIENQLHWVLDVDLLEDAARSRKDNAPHNLATIRKIALNLLRTNPDKGSIKGKIKRAGWDDAFLLTLLGQMR